MAQLLLVSKKTAKPNVQEEGDIIGIYEDSHVFSSTEQEIFDIMQIPGFTKEQLRLELNKLRPETQNAWKSETTEGSLDEPSEKRLWKNNKDEWCFLEDEHKCPMSLRDTSQNIKDALSDPGTDFETKQALIAGHVKETISLNTDNMNKVDKLYQDGGLIQG